MPIEVDVTNQTIEVSTSGQTVEATVGSGIGPVGPQGPSGVVTVSAPLVNGGTASAASISISLGDGLNVVDGELAADYTGQTFTDAVVAAAPPTTDASLLTAGTLPDARLSANIARTSDITTAVNAVIGSAPEALDTLNELAAALGDDANFASTVTTALAGKAPASHASQHGAAGSDPITVAASQISGGSLPMNAALDFSDGSGTDSEVGPWGFGVETNGGSDYSTVTPTGFVIHAATSSTTIGPGNVTFGNGTSLAVGTFDLGLGGYSGISLNCAVGYQLNWQAGHLVSTADNGATPADIYVDSPLKFAGGGGPSPVQIDNTGLTFNDGSTQTVAYQGPPVIAVADYASLPGTGENDKIYLTRDNGQLWWWDGSNSPGWFRAGETYTGEFLVGNPAASSIRFAANNSVQTTAWTGSATFSQVADTTTYVNFNTTAGSLADALSGIDSALSGKALAADFDQGVKTTDSPEFASVEFNAYAVDWTVAPRSSLGAAFDFKATLSGVTTTVFSISNTGLVQDCSIPWALLTDVPSTFTPSAHNQAWSTIHSTPTTLAGYGITDAASQSHTHSAADVTSGVFDVALLPVGTGSTQVAAGNHTHAQLHDRSHAITSSSDHTATAWRVFYSNGSGVVTELAIGASGTVLTSGGASAAPTFSTPPSGGSTNVWIPASAFIPRTTNGCGVDSRETSTNRTNWDELLFDAGADEFAQAAIVMPSNYNAGTITAMFYWTASGATDGSDDVIWGIQARAFANDDALDTAFGTAQTVTDTVIATNDMHVSSATSAVTVGGTPAANVPLLIQIYRDADAAGDTYGHDARLLGVEISYTAA